MGFPPRSAIHRLPFFYGWVIVLAAVCANIARQAAAVAPLSVFIIPMSTEFDWSRTSLSGAVSVGGVLGAIISPLLGRIVDKQGPRLVLFVSTLIVGGACFALASTASLLAFYVAFAISRMTFLGPMDLGTTAAVAKWFVHQRARAMSVMSLGHYIGLALMPLLAQFVINGYGWRAGWISLGVVVLVVGSLPVLLLMVRRPEDVGLHPDGAVPGTQTTDGAGTSAAAEYSFTVSEALRTPSMWLLMLFSGLIFMVQAGMSLHQAPHLIERGLSPTIAATIVGVFSISAALGTVIVGLLGNRLPVRLGLIVGVLIMAVSTVVMHGVSTSAQGFLAAFLFGSGLGVTATLLPVVWANYYGRENYGAIRGIALSAQVIGQAAGPLIAGVLYDLSGSYYKPFAVFFLACIVCMVLALLAAKPQQRPRSEQALTSKDPGPALSAGDPNPPAMPGGIELKPEVAHGYVEIPTGVQPTSASPPRGSIYPLVRLFASLALMTVGGSAMYASITVLGPLTAEFGGGRGSGSLQYTLFMLGFGIGGVMMGRLSDRTGVLIPAMIGSICLPLGFLAAAHASSMWQFLFAFSGLCGFLGASVTMAPVVSDISHWFTARRGLAVGIVVTGTYLAGAVWPPILQAAYDSQGWRQTFIELAIFTGCAMLPLCALLYRAAPKPVAETTIKSAGNTAALGFSPNGLQCTLCLAGIGCCVAMAMPQVHIIPYVLDHGIPAARGAEMLSLMLGFGIISRLGSGWLSDRIGGLHTLIIGSALQGLVLVAFLFADTLVALYATSMAFGLAQGGIVPSYAIIVRRFLPSGEAGWRIATALMFTVGGMALGGWMAGALYDLTGSYTVSFVNAIAFNLMNLGIAAFLILRARKLGEDDRLAA